LYGLDVYDERMVSACGFSVAIEEELLFYSQGAVHSRKS
jgi:hypothetical protein